MSSPTSALFLTRLSLGGVALFAFLITPISLSADLDYIVLQVPGCASTTAWGVNDRGDVVGTAGSCEGGEAFAFLYRDGAYFDIDVPGAVTTIPTDINDDGIVVGYFYTTDNQLEAFTFWYGQHRTISVPGVDLVPQGINNRGDITGWIPTSPYQAFFLTKSGRFTILTVEGVEGLQAWKINSWRVIVGTGYSPLQGSVSFVYRRGAAGIGRLPGMYYAVNDRGDIAAEVPGSGFVVYRDGAPLDLNHPEVNYTIFDLSKRWAVGVTGDGFGYRIRLP